MRVDSHVYTGYDISPYYDSMIGKIIVHAPDRTQAIHRMVRALSEFMIEGPQTTVPLGIAVLLDARFANGDYTTKFLDQYLAEGAFQKPDTR